MIANYPIIDGHKKKYLLFPTEKNGKWRASGIVGGGYINPFGDPTKLDYENFEDCNKACQIHNDYYFSQDQQEKIREWSFNN